MDRILKRFLNSERYESVSPDESTSTEEPEQLLHKAWEYSWPQNHDKYPEELRPYLQFICDALAVDFVAYPGKQREDWCELMTPSGDERHTHLTISVRGNPRITVDLIKENKSGSTEPPLRLGANPSRASIR